MEKAIVKSGKSKLDLEMDVAFHEAKGKKGIQFYCGVRHSFVFIPNTDDQTINYTALKK
jgi:hypothetical protein